MKIEAAAKRLYRAATTALPDPPADDADESEQRAFLQAVEDWKSDLCFTAGWGGADLDRHIPAEYREVEPPDENGVATTTFKRPLSAHEFVAFDLYREVLAELSNRTTCILGHTRWPTRGTPAEPLNNQPIRRGRTLGTQYVQSDVMGGWGG